MTEKFVEIETTEKKVERIPLKPCLACGGYDIKFVDCGYTTFNVCLAICNGCGRQLKRSGDYTKEQLVNVWNSRNGKLTDHHKVRILRAQLRRHNIDPEV